MHGLDRAFARIGARVRISASSTVRVGVSPEGTFLLELPLGTEALALSVLAAHRHLLLLVRASEDDRFLCGHDERAWFVAGLPASARVSTVHQALDALRPPAVRALEQPRSRKHRRKLVWRRQGEWFFVPRPELVVDSAVVLCREPLLAAPRATPHVAEEAVRLGGESVYLLRYFPGDAYREWARLHRMDPGEPLTAGARNRLFEELPDARRWSWDVRRRDADVCVRGRVRHPDHATVVLCGWHQVFLNTEERSGPGGRVMFLD
jgi:hypothetical protein